MQACRDGDGANLQDLLKQDGTASLVIKPGQVILFTDLIL